MVTERECSELLERSVAVVVAHGQVGSSETVHTGIVSEILNGKFPTVRPTAFGHRLETHHPMDVLIPSVDEITGSKSHPQVVEIDPWCSCRRFHEGIVAGQLILQL